MTSQQKVMLQLTISCTKQQMLMREGGMEVLRVDHLEAADPEMLASLIRSC